MLLQQGEVLAGVGLPRDVRVVLAEHRAVWRHHHVVVCAFAPAVPQGEGLVASVTAVGSLNGRDGGFGAQSDGVRPHDLKPRQFRVDGLVELTLDVVETLGGLGDVEGHRERVEELVEVPERRVGQREGTERGGERSND